MSAWGSPPNPPKLALRNPAELISEIRAINRQLSTAIKDREVAERQVRDMTLEAERLRKENARLRSLIGEKA